MAKFHSSNSFLRNAGLIDNFLDVNNLPRMPKGLYDEDYEIGSDVEGRPDILAYKVYGTTSLWWVFALRNPDVLKDPIRDFKAGITIKLPSPESVKSVAGG
jgi:hypothetical protein